jgi:SulP family sulfate permease
MTRWHRTQAALVLFDWAKDLKYWPNVRRDVVAGLTVAMLLIPQSLAYAQLAGLPIYYGLYAAFIPPIIASLFASSRYLSTGPVAITSLLTASVLQNLAVSGSDEYIAYAIALCLLAGIIQCGLGALKLGRVMNFISYPVMIGFANAAAIIIALAQLGNLIGIPTPPATHAIDAFFKVIQDIPNLVNIASLSIGLLAILLIIIGQYYFRRWPIVLMVALLTTLIAWLTNYQQQRTVTFDQIINPSIAMLIKSRASFEEDSAKLIVNIEKAQRQVDEAIDTEDTPEDKMAGLMNQLSQAKWQLEQRIIRDKVDKTALNRIRLRELSMEKGVRYFIEGQMSPIGKVGKKVWQIDDYYLDYVDIRTGGEVVGSIPSGLPSFQLIALDSRLIKRLLIGALAIALIGFMESIAVAKRYATDKRESLSINQELVSQGLAKISGAFFQSMPVSGGFARTALNMASGARTNFSNIVAGLTVGLILLVGTGLFYYLPKATLAAIIIVSVIGLVNFPAMFHIFRVSRNEGFLALFTFAATLLLAPRIDYAILLGVLVSLVIYLNEGMNPKIVELVRQDDNEWGEVRPGQATCYLISMIRFGGSLYFANATYFADTLLELVRSRPKLKYIIVDCIRVNKIDASGLQALENVVFQLDDAGVEVWFVRMRQSVKTILEHSQCPLLKKETLFFASHRQAIDALTQYLGAKHMNNCPLAKIKGKH